MVDRAELKTDRLLLRPFRLGDVADVLDYAADDEWARYLLVPSPYTVLSAEEFVARNILRSWEDSSSFAIVLNGRCIGSTGLRVELKDGRAEIGYAIARAYWGQGLTPEAATAVMDWAFQTYALEKIYAFTDQRNRQSWRVMEKLGMSQEALFRKHSLHRGSRIDIVCYGMLRDE